MTQNSRDVEPIDIHITLPGSERYVAGRELAARVYRHVWDTPSMSDEYALGVVALRGGRTLGNANLHARGGQPLPSEKYFCEQHWRQQFDVRRQDIGEVGALAADSDLEFQDAELSLIGMMYGLCLGARILNLRLLSTVEHRALARRLSGYLGLPLVQNKVVTKPSAHVPGDLYWQGGEAPQLYYIDLEDPVLLHATGLIHVYLVRKNVHIRIGDEVPAAPQNYLAFKERCASLAAATGN